MIYNRVISVEQDLKYTFTTALLPLFKLEVLNHDDISFVKIIDKFLKNDTCIL